MQDISNLRQEYNKFTLDESSLPHTPFELFSLWWKDAEQVGVPELNAMTLSTVDDKSQPHARIVLLKYFSDEGFVFFTNYLSHKGHQIEHNSLACLLFFWSPLERQIRIAGRLDKTSEEENRHYFYSRPFSSQIGAIVSNQSATINGRQELDKRYNEWLEKYKDKPSEVPYPKHWGGYRLKPSEIEFWQGRPSRLHDRILYVPSERTGQWNISRLSP